MKFSAEQIAGLINGVIVGDSATLGNDRFFGEFLEYVESVAGYRTAWEFMY